MPPPKQHDVNGVTLSVSPGDGWINPNVAKAGGLQSQGAKGEAVVDLLQTFGNAGSGVLRLSRRVKKMEQNRTLPRMDRGFSPVVRAEFALASTHMAFSEVFSIFFMQRWGKDGLRPYGCQASASGASRQLSGSTWAWLMAATKATPPKMLPNRVGTRKRPTKRAADASPAIRT